jgi:translation initiation factor 1
MGKNKRSSKVGQSSLDGLVFSTDATWKQAVSSDLEQDAVDATKQTLYVSLNRKQRAGKPVTFIEGFQGSAMDLLLLGKQLKKECGVGGAVKEGCVLIQGDHRDRVVLSLEKQGFRVKRKGG